MQNVKNNVFVIVADALGFPEEEICGGLSLGRFLGARSSDLMMIRSELMNSFAIKIPRKTVGTWMIVGDVVNSVQDLVNKNQTKLIVV